MDILEIDTGEIVGMAIEIIRKTEFCMRTRFQKNAVETLIPDCLLGK